MFTGIVEELGQVVSLERLTAAARLVVHGVIVTADARHGESISVNGCCLTVVEVGQQTFAADVMLETLSRTAVGELAPGDPVNLERAVTAGSRLGGHLVQGHVDATGSILERIPDEHWEVVRVALPPTTARYVVDKGSIAVDGVSLTVVEAGRDSFTVSLVPATLALTTLGSKQVGEIVNLEFDIIGKYVERMLGAHVQSLAPTGTTPAATSAREQR
jgi:riboflavin synthase